MFPKCGILSEGESNVKFIQIAFNQTQM
jgi:hypothetical protein